MSFSASFIQLWLMPRLANFKDRYPDVPLRIEISSRDDNLMEEDIHLSGRLGKGDWPSLQSWHFVDEEI
ncbi:hypothetical protein RFN29_32595 [Mesorhizobium sp. VK22B]|uniref:LysR substrate-binding domain-containing protein n=1 Tax=Mesorhizobium captivum TaxID=3072319 RepID=A0ABU4ZE67_9HYPH|nr:LysR substrate-binding domain-containing protein [Mesorhizobium sp. VK22B]MDX8496269.1 hypothetical protein [Mesorhizobium sp. VK22B]